MPQTVIEEIMLKDSCVFIREIQSCYLFFSMQKCNKMIVSHESNRKIVYKKLIRKLCFFLKLNVFVEWSRPRI